MFKKHLILLTSLLLLNACATTKKPVNEVTVNSMYLNENGTVELFELIGVDGKQFDKSSVPIGDHIFYIQGLKSLPTSQKVMLHSLHSIRVKLEAGSVYNIRAKTDNSEATVWLQDETKEKIASTASIKNMESIKKDNINSAGIERIVIEGKKVRKPFMRMKRDTCNMNKLTKGHHTAFTDDESENNSPRGKDKWGCKFANKLYYLHTIKDR